MKIKYEEFEVLVPDIEAATAVSSADEHDSHIRCRTRGCRGTIRTALPNQMPAANRPRQSMPPVTDSYLTPRGLLTP